MRRSLLVTCVLLVIAIPAVHGQPAEGDGMHRFTRISSDSTGASYFSEEMLPLVLLNPGPGIPPTPASAPVRATGMRILCPPAGAEVDWHAAPSRQLNVMLSGEYEVEVSDGTIRRFGPGSLILVEDLAGQGHRTRVSGASETCFAALRLPEEALTGTAQASATDAPVRGTLAPRGGPAERVLQPVGDAACVIDLTQDYDIAGTLTGSAQIDYRILVHGPCGTPAGSHDEEWIAIGTFDGSRAGTAAEARFEYVARVRAGGVVEGRMVFEGGISGELRIHGNFADGRLSYEGAVR